MCRLFGLYANRGVNVQFSFYEAEKSLEKLSRLNPDGWGIAWFHEGWHLYKEPWPLYLSKNAKKLAKDVYGVIVVSHVRFATQGKAKLEKHILGSTKVMFLLIMVQFMIGIRF